MRGFERRKIRVVRIVVVRGDRHMTFGVPSSIARILFRSLDRIRRMVRCCLLFLRSGRKKLALRRTRRCRNIDLESTDGNAKGREDDVQTGTSCCPLLALALLSSRIIIVLVDNVSDLYISAA